MNSETITWEHDLTSALAAAERERRFLMVDFSREH